MAGVIISKKQTLPARWVIGKPLPQLGDAAFALDDYPNDPIERFVFIEGYAHTADWEKAVELSMDSYKVSKKYVGPLLCKLWDRIARETESTPEQNVTLDMVQSQFRVFTIINYNCLSS